MVPYDNPSYNPEEPEDEFYNPKELEENVYPELNVSELNAGVLLRKLNLYVMGKDMCGEIAVEQLPSFIEFLRGLSNSDPIDENCDRMTTYINRLLIVARTAKALNSDLVYA
jgi:hypothetical protein